MKKITLSLMIFVLSLTVLPSLASASTPESLAPTTATEVPAEVQKMYDRLEEIKAMDKSEMTRAEKKELRKEVRAIKADLKASGNGGIYLSVGAIIIIILLLILLL
ncbi:hypothetical protein [Flavobacterium wongokense]|uniref:hypothetical protein n=1 Tax=Flavobacterium wongokense TaxID=2910674 RepID=UPI001F3556A6|nr:hypothetical protein [Flavobacterium sp. WG47]MCF6132206.1 hypothetical protein [Flavobacterium sp. WG47]